MNEQRMAAGSPAADARGLRRFRAPAPQRPERCELCATELTGRHRHLVDRERQSLACACTACSLLFDRPGSGGGRFSPVPDRCLSDPAGELSDVAWDALQIPVSVAFFFHNSDQDRLVALYPSPAGATESELDGELWESVLGSSRLANLLRPDVEALLVRRSGGPGAADGGCYLVPVDMAYELVGRLRKTWQGFDGGAEARAELNAFFERVEARATQAPAPQEGERQCRT